MNKPTYTFTVDYIKTPHTADSSAELDVRLEQRIVAFLASRKEYL